MAIRQEIKFKFFDKLKEVVNLTFDIFYDIILSIKKDIK